MIDQETVRKILDTADIVEVVGDFVKLRRSGANYIGLCPFHNERTPSFSVSKARGYCKCFSCGKGGSPVGFIMEHEKLSYVEALRWLANKYHIEIKERELSPEERAAVSERESMFALNEFALNFFERTLSDSDEGRAIGLSYFRERGLSDASIKKFRLGFAPEKHDALVTAALAQGYSSDLLAATGLCSRSERGTLYDRFRGRVIYPVFTLSGKVVAFGGRTLKTSKEVAKYVNSPESAIYHKSDQLYGLYQARRAIVSADKCLLVEGYMDVISMSQRGVENVVASSGTSLTEGQIALLHRFTSNVTVIYDADPAGIKASLRGIDMLLAHGINVKVMLLPPGEDPDSYAKSHSLEEVEEYIRQNETDFIRFKARVMLQSMSSPDDPVARAGVIASMARSISVIPDPVLRSEYVKECARVLSTKEEVVALQVAKYRNETIAAQAPAQQQQQQETPPPPITATIPPRQSFATDSRAAYMRPTELELMRLLVRYGMLPLAESVDDSGQLIEMISVAQYVKMELEADDIRLENPDLGKLFEEILRLKEPWAAELQRLEGEAADVAARHRADSAISPQGLTMEQFKKKMDDLEAAATRAAQDYVATATEAFIPRILGASPDAEIRNLVNSLVAEKYVLSKMHSKAQKLESERDLLSTRVPKAVCGMRIAILQWQEKELRHDLLQKAATPEAADILARLQQLRSLISQFARLLGDRIILPN